VLALPSLLWMGYVIRVGGDFMEYRFVVPVLPVAFAATYWIMSVLIPQPLRAALLTSLVIAGGMITYASPKVPKPLGSPLPLVDLAMRPQDEWFEIGTVLGAAFADGVKPRIAVVPSGVIPYRSRLPSLDMLGLTDPEVQRFTRLPDALVGHRRLAPLDLLERRGVNFLIGFPVVRPRLDPGRRYSFGDFAKRPYAYPDEQRLRGRQLIEAALSRDRVLLVSYLIERAAITERIDQLGWRRYPLE
jgi:arabinofuranosyltransferase